MLINSDNQENSINFCTINVAENAELKVSNITIPATINNGGDVVMTNVLSFIKGKQHEGSTWREINNN